MDGRIISDRKGSFVVHNKCRHCSTTSLAVVSKYRQNGGQVLAVETLTDLDQEEAQKFIDARPFSMDDVLEIYQTFTN